MASGIENYLNTLIFTIVAKAITIILLVLVFTKVGQLVAWLLITIELGMIFIIIVALYNIVNYEKNMKKQLDDFLKANVTNPTCPDYHTVLVDQESTSCLNTYDAPDKSTYTFQSKTFALEPLYKDEKKKELPFNEVCANLKSNYAINNLNKVAWTDLKEKCDVTAN